MVLPEKLTCIAVNVQGTYCAGATVQGRIYLWEASKNVFHDAWLLQFLTDCFRDHVQLMGCSLSAN